MTKKWKVGISRTNGSGEMETGSARVYADTSQEAVAKVREHVGSTVATGTAEEVPVSPAITWLNNDED